MRRNAGHVRRELADQIRNERRRAFLLSNVVAPALIALLILVLPFDARMWQRIVCIGMVIFAVVADRASARWLAASLGDFVMLAVRIAIAIVIAGVVPALWYAAAVLIGSLVGGAIFVEPRGRVVGLTIAATGGLAATALVQQVDGWYLPLLIFVIAIVSVEAWFHDWNAERLELERRHNELIDHAAMFAWEVDDTTGQIINVTGNVESLLGYRAHQLVGRDAVELMVPSTMWDTQETDPFRHGSVVSATHRDGSETVLRQMHLSTNRSTTTRGVSIDITELAAATEALRHQANHDALTGLANRQLLEQVVGDILSRNEPVALIVADLDRFKEINDTLGHPTGDRLLRVLGRRFETSLADVELVARMGGDEFAFVLAGEGVFERAKAFADDVVRIAAEPMSVDGMSLAVSCSAGVAVAPAHGTTHAELLKHADIASYDAKRSGCGASMFESTPDELSVRRLRLISELSGALHRREFELFFQPQVDLTSGAIVGVEGLARWRHPALGLLAPGQFLEAVEVGAGYHRFTAEMLRCGIEFAARCAANGRPTPVALNLGSMSFLDRGLPSRVAALLSEHGVRAELITLEVTESDLLDEEGADAPVFEALVDLGVRLSIDDFGTGYSNLTRLRSLAVNEVKIDRAFVSGLESVTEDAIIVRTIVDLADLLGHEVVAEGVETVGQLNRLRRFGCQVAQGFLFDRPLPADDAERLIIAQHRYDIGRNATVGLTELKLDAEVQDGLMADQHNPEIRRAITQLFGELGERYGERTLVLVRDRASRVVQLNAAARALIEHASDEASDNWVGRSVNRSNMGGLLERFGLSEPNIVPLRLADGRTVGSVAIIEYHAAAADREEAGFDSVS